MPAAVTWSAVWRVATGAMCVACVVLGLLGSTGGLRGSLVLSLGPLGGVHLALDAVSALFLLVVALYGAAAALECDGRAALVPVAVGSMALVVLAADGFTLVLGFGLMSVASGRLDPADRRRAAVAILSLMLAMELLAPAGTLRFAAMRAVPPEGMRAAAVLVLALLAVGSQLAWPSRPGAVGAALGGGMAATAVYVLIRTLFDLCGPTAPVWWGLPLMASGAGAMVLGGVRANVRDDLLAILAANRLGAAGLAVAGLGIALAAHGADADPMAALALAGVLLHMACYAAFDTLLVLCGSAVQRYAGASALPHMGGLIRSMPGVTLGVLAGAACLAGFPVTAGFAGRWLLLQSVLVAPHLGLGLQISLAGVLLAIALGCGLAAAAAVRLVGIGFLGRPRTSEAAAAQDAPRRMRLIIAGLAGFCVLLGVWPSLPLALVQPVLDRLLGLGLDGGGWLTISAQVDGPGYTAPAIALALALSGAAAVWLARRFGGAGARIVPAWDGGFEAAPSLLPQGDPMTQYSAASASQTLIRSLALIGSLGMASPRLQALRETVQGWAARAVSWVRRRIARRVASQ